MSSLVMKQFRDTDYYVTEEGNVYRYIPKGIHVSTSIYKGKKCRYEYPKPERYRLLKNMLSNRGYERVCLYFGEGKKSKQTWDVHRMVAELYCDGYFKDAHVDHIDCNKSNNHYTNLQWCTQEYNVTKGTNPNYPLFAQI